MDRRCGRAVGDPPRARAGGHAARPLGRVPAHIMTRPSFTIGIEEEYQTVDPITFDLRSHIQTEIMAKGKRQMKERIKAEMHQAVVEVGTGICRTVKDAAEDLKYL